MLKFRPQLGTLMGRDEHFIGQSLTGQSTSQGLVFEGYIYFYFVSLCLSVSISLSASLALSLSLFLLSTLLLLLLLLLLSLHPPAPMR